MVCAICIDPFEVMCVSLRKFSGMVRPDSATYETYLMVSSG